MRGVLEPLRWVGGECETGVKYEDEEGSEDRMPGVAGAEPWWM